MVILKRLCFMLFSFEIIFKYFNQEAMPCILILSLHKSFQSIMENSHWNSRFFWIPEFRQFWVGGVSSAVVNKSSISSSTSLEIILQLHLRRVDQSILSPQHITCEKRWFHAVPEICRPSVVVTSSSLLLPKITSCKNVNIPQHFGTAVTSNPVLDPKLQHLHDIISSHSHSRVQRMD